MKPSDRLQSPNHWQHLDGYHIAIDWLPRMAASPDRLQQVKVDEPRASASLVDRQQLLVDAARQTTNRPDWNPEIAKWLEVYERARNWYKQRSGVGQGVNSTDSNSSQRALQRGASQHLLRLVPL